MHQTLVRKVMKVQGPMKAAEALEDAAAAYDMDNTRGNKAREQDRLVLAGRVEAA